jgi:hypothetical protein
MRIPSISMTTISTSKLAFSRWMKASDPNHSIAQCCSSFRDPIIILSHGSSTLRSLPLPRLPVTKDCKYKLYSDFRWVYLSGSLMGSSEHGARAHWRY